MYGGSLYAYEFLPMFHIHLHTFVELLYLAVDLFFKGLPFPAPHFNLHVIVPAQVKDIGYSCQKLVRNSTFPCSGFLHNIGLVLPC